ALLTGAMAQVDVIPALIVTVAEPHSLVGSVVYRQIGDREIDCAKDDESVTNSVSGAVAAAVDDEVVNSDTSNRVHYLSNYRSVVRWEGYVLKIVQCGGYGRGVSIDFQNINDFGSVSTTYNTLDIDVIYVICDVFS